MPLRTLEDLATDATFPTEQFERVGRPAAGRNRTQSPPKHRSHARRKTYCHGGVGMNRTQGRPAVRLIQLQSARSAPKQAPDLAPGTVARSTFTTTPPSAIPHQSGQRDSNPRHSAWEADALPTELCPRTLISLSMGLMLLVASCRLLLRLHAPCIHSTQTR